MSRPTPPYVRNACVARGSAAGDAGRTIYTVPAQTVLLLKDVLLTPTTGTRPTNYALYAVASSGVYVVIVDAAWPSASFANWSGWVALNAGDSIQVNATGAPVAYWISGALLPFAGELPTQ